MHQKYDPSGNIFTSSYFNKRNRQINNLDPHNTCAHRKYNKNKIVDHNLFYSEPTDDYYNSNHSCLNIKCVIVTTLIIIAATTFVGLVSYIFLKVTT